MDPIAEVVTEGLLILGAVASVYLAVGIALAFLEAQIDAAVDRPSGRDILQRIALLVACVALVAFAQSVKNDVAGLLGDYLGDTAATRSAILRIGQYFLDIVIGAAALVMAISVVMGFAGAQLAAAAGQSLHLSEIVARLAMVVGLAMGAFFTISIVNAVIAALR